jgi:hypothetical protein
MPFIVDFFVWGQLLPLMLGRDATNDHWLKRLRPVSYEVHIVSARIISTSTGADPEGVLGSYPPPPPPPALGHPIFFFNKLVNYGQQITRNILWALFTLICDLEIIQPAANFHVPRIATQYHFAPKLYRQDSPEIASRSMHVDFKIFWERTPRPLRSTQPILMRFAAYERGIKLTTFCNGDSKRDHDYVIYRLKNP